MDEREGQLRDLLQADVIMLLDRLTTRELIALLGLLRAMAGL